MLEYGYGIYTENVRKIYQIEWQWQSHSSLIFNRRQMISIESATTPQSFNWLLLLLTPPSLVLFLWWCFKKYSVSRFGNVFQKHFFLLFSLILFQKFSWKNVFYFFQDKKNYFLWFCFEKIGMFPRKINYFLWFCFKNFHEKISSKIFLKKNIFFFDFG